LSFFEHAQTASLLGAGPSLWLGEPQRLWPGHTPWTRSGTNDFLGRRWAPGAGDAVGSHGLDPDGCMDGLELWEPEPRRSKILGAWL